MSAHLRQLAGSCLPRLVGAWFAAVLFIAGSADARAGLILPSAPGDESLAVSPEASAPDLSWLFEPPVRDDASSGAPEGAGGPAIAYRGRDDIPFQSAAGSPSPPRPAARASLGGPQRRPLPPPGGVFRPPRG